MNLKLAFRPPPPPPPVLFSRLQIYELPTVYYIHLWVLGSVAVTIGTGFKFFFMDSCNQLILGK